MSLVTSGAETWVPHTHRHHHGGGTTWLFGPDGPSLITGADPTTVPAAIGSYEFLFLAASGTTSGDMTYDAGVLSATPSFPAGSDPGSVIGWYVGPGGPGNGGPPGIVFDAFNASADDWIDWDHTNDPFTVTSGARQPGPDDDDQVVTSDAAAVVSAAEWFPGAGSLVFDHWLVFDTGHQHVSANQVTQDEQTSGYAIAVYKQPTSPHWKWPDVPWAYDPWWWLKNSPVEGVQQVIREQGEAAQITTLIDLSTAISSPRARAMVQHGLYEALISVAHQHLNESPARELATH